MNDEIEEIDQVIAAEQQQALQRIEPQPPALRVVTPQEARNESIATMLDAAYQRASTLQLTPDEAKDLAADFPDEAFELGAGGDRNLLYLSHVYLRQRLNQVLGVGAAVPIRRREWSEEFQYYKDGKTKNAARVYVEMVLIVRGCVVGEAIADAIYYKENSGDSYADTLEKAKSNAFRRCCKEFGVGLQPWMKGFCEEWKQRNSASGSVPRQYTTPAPRPTPKPAPQPNVERTQAAPVDVLPKGATQKTREWALGQLMAQFPEATIADFLFQKGWIKPAEPIEYWNMNHIPTSRAGLQALIDEIQKSTSQVPESQQNPAESNNLLHDLPPEIADAVITVPRRGMKRADYMQNPDTIGGLYAAMKDGDQEAQKRLWGMVKGWNPEPYVDGNGKKWPVKQEDFDCRVSLDLFAEWHKDHGGESNEN